MKALQLALITALVLAAPSKANIITNPGFETGDFTGWTLTFDHPDDGPLLTVDTVNPHSGTYGAGFGNYNDSATLSQTLVTTPGVNYTFSFWLANSEGPSNSFAALWDGSPVGILADAPASPYQQVPFSVTATSNTTVVQFSFIHNGLGFWDLDDVSVEEVSSPTPIPEPATISLLGLGLLGLGLLRRRR